MANRSIFKKSAPFTERPYDLSRVEYTKRTRTLRLENGDKLVIHQIETVGNEFKNPRFGVRAASDNYSVIQIRSTFHTNRVFAPNDHETETSIAYGEQPVLISLDGGETIFEANELEYFAPRTLVKAFSLGSSRKSKFAYHYTDIYLLPFQLSLPHCHHLPRMREVYRLHRKTSMFFLAEFLKLYTAMAMATGGELLRFRPEDFYIDRRQGRVLLLQTFGNGAPALEVLRDLAQFFQEWTLVNGGKRGYGEMGLTGPYALFLAQLEGGEFKTPADALEALTSILPGTPYQFIFWENAHNRWRSVDSMDEYVPPEYDEADAEARANINLPEYDFGPTIADLKAQRFNPRIIAAISRAALLGFDDVCLQEIKALVAFSADPSGAIPPVVHIPKKHAAVASKPTEYAELIEGCARALLHDPTRDSSRVEALWDLLPRFIMAIINFSDQPEYERPGYIRELKKLARLINEYLLSE